MAVTLPPDILALAQCVRDNLDAKVRLLHVRAVDERGAVVVDLYPERWDECDK